MQFTNNNNVWKSITGERVYGFKEFQKGLNARKIHIKVLMDSLQDKLGMDYADEFEMQLVNRIGMLDSGQSNKSRQLIVRLH